MVNERRIRALIVEDDYLVSEMVRGLLEECGYTVLGLAVNGSEAVEMTATLKPDVVLMDIRMPDMDGIEAARRIRQRCPTPVVILSAYETPELLREASAAGVGAYLVKPPNAQAIDRAVTIAMARFRDLQELHALNEDLRARNEELDAFAYIVAHDLQNPLSLVIGFAEAVRKYYQTMSVQEIEECLRTIEQTGHKMSETIDKLLLMARARTADIEMKPLDMGKIVAGVQQRLAHLIEQHQATLYLPKTWPAALGQELLVEEVWLNYLGNALKYANQPPNIALGGEKQADGQVCFWVRDNGPGIPPDRQEDLFKPFTRLGQGGGKGYGLGLAIVQRFVARMGGRVSVESEVGRGSTFKFTLPAADR